MFTIVAEVQALAAVMMCAHTSASNLQHALQLLRLDARQAAVRATPSAEASRPRRDSNAETTRPKPMAPDVVD